MSTHYYFNKTEIHSKPTHRQTAAPKWPKQAKMEKKGKNKEGRRGRSTDFIQILIDR